MITQERAVEIAHEYIKNRTGHDLRLMHVSYEEGKPGSYIAEPTWWVWFHRPREGVTGQVEVYVDAASGEPWTLNYGSPAGAAEGDPLAGRYLGGTPAE